MTTILQVIDTRDRDWARNDGKPIPGTGDKRPCDCCGKDHEVHVYLATANGRKIVGTSCVKTLRKTEQVVSSDRRRDRIKYHGGYVGTNNLRV